MPNLVIADLTLKFGGITALDNVSFAVEDKQLCALVGPNGAGKSSLFNCVSGLYRPAAGSITFGESSLVGLRPDRIARQGVGRTFQNLAFSPSLTLLENVLLGGITGSGMRPFASALRLPSLRRAEIELRERGRELFDHFAVGDVANAFPDEVPFGTLKRVELVRALMLEPKLLLVDEPAGGLTHEEISELASVIKQVNKDFETSVLLVEHHMGFVMSISDKVVVLDGGRKIAEGLPSEVSRDPVVIEAYLGVAA